MNIPIPIHIYATSVEYTSQIQICSMQIRFLQIKKGIGSGVDRVEMMSHNPEVGGSILTLHGSCCVNE